MSSVSSTGSGLGQNIPPSVAGAASAGLVHPIALSEMHSDSSDAAASLTSAPVVAAGVNPLHQVRTTLQVCVGSATLTVGELLGAKEQQVLQLDRTVHQPVDLVLEGHVVARGQLVAVGDHFAVRITELPVSLTVGAPGTP
ncbi:flagellar motor switch protein [Acidovorax sp. 1608163]|nr:flagellar motor switch protein [Acidovorax sp. 1608163]